MDQTRPTQTRPDQPRPDSSCRNETNLQQVEVQTAAGSDAEIQVLVLMNKGDNNDEVGLATRSSPIVSDPTLLAALALAHVSVDASVVQHVCPLNLQQEMDPGPSFSQPSTSETSRCLEVKT